MPSASASFSTSSSSSLSALLVATAVVVSGTVAVGRPSSSMVVAGFASAAPAISSPLSSLVGEGLLIPPHRRTASSGNDDGQMHFGRSVVGQGDEHHRHRRRLNTPLPPSSVDTSHTTAGAAADEKEEEAAMRALFHDFKRDHGRTYGGRKKEKRPMKVQHFAVAVDERRSRSGADDESTTITRIASVDAVGDDNALLVDDDEEEEALRYSYFVASVKEARVLAKANPLARFGINRFADWSAEEFGAVYSSSTAKGEGHKQKGLPMMTMMMAPQPNGLVDEGMVGAGTNKQEKNPSSPSFSAMAQRSSTSSGVDWRQNGAVTPVKDQGRLACGGVGWAFAATGSIEGQWAIAGNGLVSLSEQMLISCDSFNAAFGCGGGGGPAMTLEAFQWLANSTNSAVTAGGWIATEASYPYTSSVTTTTMTTTTVAPTTASDTTATASSSTTLDNTATPTAAANIPSAVAPPLLLPSSAMLTASLPPQCITTPSSWSKGAQIINSTVVASSELAMGVWVKSNGPLAVSVDSTSWRTYVDGIMTNCASSSNQTDHAALIVGYDAANVPPYWIIKNSWGTSWGEEGYIRLYKGNNQCMITTLPVSAVVDDTL